MKIDLHKTFDSVHWQFLRELIEHMRFPLKFMTWIMRCLTSVTYKIHVNGEIGEVSKGGRCLKQEDPLTTHVCSLNGVFCKVDDGDKQQSTICFSSLMQITKVEPPYVCR